MSVCCTNVTLSVRLLCVLVCERTLLRGTFFQCLVSSSLSPSLSLCWGGGGREVTIATMPGQINIKFLKKHVYMYESACICGKGESVVLDILCVTPKSGRGTDVNASITNNSLGPQPLHHSVSSVWFQSTCLLPYFVVSALLFPLPSLSLCLSVCCCVPPGYRVPRPPSPLLSLWPCHLQLLHGTRHTATGKEREERGHTHTQRERKRGEDRGTKRCICLERDKEVKKEGRCEKLREKMWGRMRGRETTE